MSERLVGLSPNVEISPNIRVPIFWKIPLSKLQKYYEDCEKKGFFAVTTVERSFFKFPLKTEPLILPDWSAKAWVTDGLNESLGEGTTYVALLGKAKDKRITVQVFTCNPSFPILRIG